MTSGPYLPSQQPTWRPLRQRRRRKKSRRAPGMTEGDDGSTDYAKARAAFLPTETTVQPKRDKSSERERRRLGRHRQWCSK